MRREGSETFEGVEAFRAALVDVCGDFAVEPLASAPGIARCGRVAGRAVGRFDAADVTLTARHVTRDRAAIRRDPGEHLFLLSQEQGEAWVHQADRVIHLPPGALCVVDSARPSRFVYGAGVSRQLSLHLPRAEMAHRFGEGAAAGLAVGRDDPLWAPLRSVMGRMARASAAEGPGLSEALLGLMGAWLAARAAGEAGDRLVGRALALIDTDAADPGFGPARLAARLNVSERVLQRHFQSIGETPGRAIVNARLDRAQARLRAGHGPIAEVAFSCGFNDVPYFYRAFRRRFGVTPGAALSGLSKTARRPVQCQGASLGSG